MKLNTIPVLNISSVLFVGTDDVTIIDCIDFLLQPQKCFLMSLLVSTQTCGELPTLTRPPHPSLNL